MSEPLPVAARSTTTLHSYVENLAAAETRSAALLMGLRWGFGLPPAESLRDLMEYSLPASPEPCSELLARRGGLRIRQHAGSEETALDDHLEAGKPAIVAIDAFYFPFRPAFRRVHSARTAVVVRRGDGELEIRDGWAPPICETVSRELLDEARFSAVPRDLDREPLFSGTPIGGTWFEVEIKPATFEDVGRWMRGLLGELYGDMATARRDEAGQYGLDALRAFHARLLEGLDGNEAETIEVRRGACLLLRPELSSRLYLGVALRTAAHHVGDEALAEKVALYRQRLGHFQAVTDCLAKTIRLRRPEYDAFLRHHLRALVDNEAFLLEALAPYGS